MNRLLAVAAACCAALLLALPWTAAAAGSASPSGAADAASSAGGERYEVTADILNVRAEPSLDAAVIGKIRQGAVVEKLDEQGVWYRIRLGGLTGWAHSDYLQRAGEATGGQPDGGGAGGSPEAGGEASPDDGALTRTDRSARPRVIGRAIRVAPERQKPADEAEEDGEGGTADGSVHAGHVLGDSVRVRSGPGLDYRIEGLLNRGERVTVTGSDGEWYRIVTESGLAGWIAAAYVGFGPEEAVAVSALRGKTIVVDPGHGGSDSGTIGTTHGTYEKTLNLSTAIHLKRELELLGASVVMTRVTDEEKPSLKERVAIAAQSGGDAFVSIHYNSAASASASGILTFYYSSGKDMPLAAAIENRLAEGTLGLASRGVSFGNFQVIRENSLPAVLIELGFLTNPQDEERVRTDDYQMAAARAIALGLADYLASAGEKSWRS